MSSTLAGMDVVVHCAARVHVMRETSADPLIAFRAANVAGTKQLARQAAAAGVRRFVFLSSVKVNGEGGLVAYHETDPPAPQDAYGISKYEAELGLCEIAVGTGMEVVLVRSPLIYGPGVKANFQALMRALMRLFHCHSGRSITDAAWWRWIMWLI
jgi:UDP-glucose 4-epimerase